MSATLDKPKTKYPRAAALDVARLLVACLKPCCSHLIVAGSLRRLKPEVGDVEILYVPNIVTGPDPDDLFGKQKSFNAVDVALAELIDKHAVLGKRPNIHGHTAWGAKNKLAVHLASGIPVDLFEATVENWWNLVVCRTGGQNSNVEISMAAQRAGWNWNPYGCGFSRPNPERNGWSLIREIHSEREVFEFVGLPYREPKDRP